LAATGEAYIGAPTLTWPSTFFFLPAASTTRLLVVGK
jgi:hypothetical protein